MNKSETREFMDWAHKVRPVQEAFLNGKAIEYKPALGSWELIKDPTWTVGKQYRVKPSTRIVPYGKDEINAMVGTTIIRKHDSCPKVIIEGIGQCEVSCVVGREILTPSKLLDLYTHSDGRPLGNLEEIS